MAKEVHREVGEFAGVDTVAMSELEAAVGTMCSGERRRFKEDLGQGGQLDGALLAQDSDTLVVTLHGLLDREKFQIPRFERARSTEPFGTSCLYWADPSLWLDPKLKLAWFTGVAAIDVLSLLAERSTAVATQLGAKQVIFTGSSGGGFAALQVSALVPGSTALVFNPQTEIYRYHTAMQRRYLANCRPDVLNGTPADRFTFDHDWSAPLDDRYSALRRYERPTGNTVIYYSNSLDWHDENHRQPFEQIVVTDDSRRYILHTYEQKGGHQPPSPGRFTDALRDALATVSTGP
ncbi:hypothetical protein [Microbacterium sp. USHLN186]|uniref:hypothetical protein n=1 Tax=Microbacterium sp. USHLN186 TaxID=3081286 RepID=UPI003015C986